MSLPLLGAGPSAGQISDPSKLEGCTLWAPVNSDTVLVGGSTLFTATNKSDLRIADATATDIEILASDWTICGWVLFTSVATGTGGVVTKGGTAAGDAGYCIYRSTTSLIAALSNGSSQVTCTLGTVAADTWYFFAVSFDRDGNAIGYLNATAGTPADISALSASINSDDPLIFGSNGTNYFGGRLQCVGIFSKALSAAEVASLYNNKNPLYYGQLSAAQKTGLVSWWNLNEPLIGDPTYVTGASATVQDQHGSNELTFTNADMVTNGTFTTDADWTKGTGWTIDSGDSNTAASDGSQSADADLDQACTFVTGNTYVTAITVARTAGKVCVVVGGTEGTDRETSATFTQAITVASTNNKIAVRADADFIGTVDNYSVKAVNLTAANGCATAIASDSVGTNHATLVGRTDEVGSWRTDNPNGSYTATVTNSGSLGDARNGTMTGFSDVDARRIADVPSGRTGHSILFDGVDDFVSVPDPGESLTTLTACCWVKTAAAPAANAYFFCHYDADSKRSWAIYFDTDGKLNFVVVSNGANPLLTNAKRYISSSSYTNNQLRHVAFTWNSGTLTTYVNGLEITPSKHLDFAFTTLYNCPGAVSIGSAINAGVWASGIAGQVYDARIYNSALSAADILAVKNNTYAATQPAGAWIDGTDQPRSVANIAGQYSLYHDGTDDYELVSVANFRSGDSAGAISLWYKGTDAAGFLFCSSDTAASVNYLALYLNGTAVEVRQRNNDTEDKVGFTVTINDGAWHHIVLVSSGIAWSMYVDDVLVSPVLIAGNNTGDWFADTDGRDNVTVGLRVDATPDTYLAGLVADIRVYDSTFLSALAANVAALYAGSEAAVNPVAHWTFDDGPQANPTDGDPVLGLLSSEGSLLKFDQSTLSARPEYEFATTGLNNQPSIKFDGVDSFLRLAQNFAPTDTAGTLFIVWLTADDVTTEQVLLGTADEASATKFWRLGIASGGLKYNQNDAGTADTLTGGTIATTTAYLIMVQSTGAANGFGGTINNAAVASWTAASGANNGDWLGDTSARDSLCLGASNANATAALFAKGYLGEVFYFNRILNASEIRRVNRYITKLWGITL